MAIALANKVMFELTDTKQYFQVTNSGGSYDCGLSDGSVIGNTSSKKYVALKDACDIKLVFGNFYVDVVNNIMKDIAGPNNINVKCSITRQYDGSGPIYPVFFNGLRTVKLSPGGLIESDSIGIELVAGDVIFVRTYVSVDNIGEFWPRGFGNSWSNGECISVGDITDSGNIDWTAGDLYGPVAIIGKGVDTAVLVVGDSVALGSGDSVENVQDCGYIQKGISSDFNYLVIARANDEINHFITPLNKINRTRMAAYCNRAIVNYGINDLASNRTLAQLQADLTSIWSTLKLMGLKVWQCTITPYTESTDNWATIDNQTIFDKDSVRVQLNDWIRTCPAPLSGYFDGADASESTRNSGKWKAGYTSDGIHPNTAGAIAMKTVINPSILL